MNTGSLRIKKVLVFQFWVEGIFGNKPRLRLHSHPPETFKWGVHVCTLSIGRVHAAGNNNYAIAST